MDLRDYLRSVRRHWWLVVVAVIIAMAVATLVTVRTPKQYASSVTFFISTADSTASTAYQGDLFSQQRVKSYVDLATSDRLADAIVQQQPSLDADDLIRHISANALPGTVLLQITVTDGDPQRSLRTAGILATQFSALVESLETPPGSTTPTVKVEVVAGPRLQATPVAPRPVRDLGLGLLLGLIIGVGAAVLRDVLDTTIKLTDVLRDVTRAPVLCAVPFDPSAKRTPLIVNLPTGSARAEALRQLRTNLQFVDVDNPVKTIVVTSSVPNEGKSTTACNLAIVFSDAGLRVLLIEADLRRPRLSEYLGLERAVGLTNVLAGQISVEDALQKWGSSGLYVLASGSSPPNPSELLGSRNMVALLDGLRARFDIVIIDTPPLLPVTDAAIMAACCDGAVLVTRYGKTATTQVRTAAAALAAVDARLLGSVLNMAPSATSQHYYYYSSKAAPRDLDTVEPTDPTRPGRAASVTAGAGDRPAAHAATSVRPR